MIGQKWKLRPDFLKIKKLIRLLLEILDRLPVFFTKSKK